MLGTPDWMSLWVSVRCFGVKKGPHVLPCRVLEDLEWSSQHTLQQLLHTLLLTAPFTAPTPAPSLPHHQQQQQMQQQHGSVAGVSAGAAAGGTAGVPAGQQSADQLRAMLQLLQPLVRSSSKRLSGVEVVLLCKVFFHPEMFRCRCAQDSLCNLVRHGTHACCW